MNFRTQGSLLNINFTLRILRLIFELQIKLEFRMMQEHTSLFLVIWSFSDDGKSSDNKNITYNHTKKVELEDY